MWTPSKVHAILQGEEVHVEDGIDLTHIISCLRPVEKQFITDYMAGYTPEEAATRAGVKVWPHHYLTSVIKRITKEMNRGEDQ